MHPVVISSSPVFLNERLWQKGTAFSKRSQELSPLYVTRYRGPRHSQQISSHEYWEFTCVLKGRGALICKEAYSLQTHTIALVPAGIPHKEQAQEEIDTIWIGVTGSRLKSLVFDDAVFIRSRKISDLFEQIWLLAEHSQEGTGMELDGMMLTIMGHYLRLLRSGADQQFDCIDRAIRYFNEHFPEKISVAETAKHFGYSEGYFQRTFRQKTGLRPVAYLTGVRCRHAAHLLEETNWSMARIAELSGYDNQFYFSRMFSRIHGRSPMDFRKKILRRLSGKSE